MAIKNTSRQYALQATVDMTYADLLTGVATKALRLPVGAIVVGGGLRTTVADNGGTSVTISVGDTASGTAYVSAANAKTLDLWTAFAVTKLGALYTAADDIKVTRTEGGTASSAGTFRLVVQYVIDQRANEVQPG